MFLPGGRGDWRWKRWQRRSTLLFGVNSHAFRKFAWTRGRFFYCRTQFFFFFGRQNLWLTQNNSHFDLITGGQAHFSNFTPLFLSKAFFFLFPFFPPMCRCTPRGAQVSTQCSHIVVATRRHFSFFSLRANEAGESPVVAVGGFFPGGWHQTLFVCPSACLWFVGWHPQCSGPHWESFFFFDGGRIECLAHLLFCCESRETNKHAIQTQRIFTNLVGKKGLKKLIWCRLFDIPSGSRRQRPPKQLLRFGNSSVPLLVFFVAK